jgi:hypothetical protein
MLLGDGLPLAGEAVQESMQWRGVCQGGLDEEEQQHWEQEEEGATHADDDVK